SLYRHHIDNVFFISSRRRHTRLQGDWNSDVCSSDLGARLVYTSSIATVGGVRDGVIPDDPRTTGRLFPARCGPAFAAFPVRARRSEERRVGKEGRSSVSAEQYRILKWLRG